MGVNDILELVTCASSCLANSEYATGSISKNRKAESLVQRWVAKPIDSIAKDGIEFVGIEDILIDRDVVILLDVKCGVGAEATVIQRQLRVLDIYKKWKNEK